MNDQGPTCIYLFRGILDGTSAYKIGISNKPKVRIYDCRPAHEIIHTVWFATRKEARHIETQLHLVFDDKAIEGWNEWFWLSHEQVNALQKVWTPIGMRRFVERGFMQRRKSNS